VQLFIWDTAEGAITIVAASIPTLRVLVRDARSTKENGTEVEPRLSDDVFPSRFINQLDELQREEGKTTGSSTGEHSWSERAAKPHQ
jgi:hypothetical protein